MAKVRDKATGIEYEGATVSDAIAKMMAARGQTATPAPPQTPPPTRPNPMAGIGATTPAELQAVRNAAAARQAAIPSRESAQADIDAALINSGQTQFAPGGSRSRETPPATEIPRADPARTKPTTGGDGPGVTLYGGLQNDQDERYAQLILRQLTSVDHNGRPAMSELEALELLTPLMAGYEDNEALARQYALDMIENARSGGLGREGYLATAQPGDNSFLKDIFPGLNRTTLRPEETRPLDETAFGAVNDRYNLGNVSPFLSDTLQRRAQQAIPQFRLGAALGQFGQYGVDDGQIQLGGQGLQGLMRNAAVNNLGGAPTTSSYRDFLGAAQSGLGSGGGQAESILAALGVTGSDSAQDAYRGIYSNFIAPRLQMLPTGIRDIFQRGAQKEIEQLLGGKSSAEINPAEVLQQFQNRGLIR